MVTRNGDIGEKKDRAVESVKAVFGICWLIIFMKFHAQFSEMAENYEICKKK